jgi:hypothetical protein
MKLSEPSNLNSFGARLAEACARQPIFAIVFVSLMAVAINCYPVIFFGKSYVAPAFGVPMLYERYPTLPGMTEKEPVYAHGSDTAATLVAGVPWGFIESRSILEHGELPLWDRYGHAGDTLIAQAVSMFGDPMQWIVILGRGSALAWDVKFVLAKFLFCVGFGLLIRRLLGSLPLAILFAALGAYCGAFFYIYNHPVFFLFCYAPWILLSALEFLDLKSRRYLLWGLVWLLVNIGGFSGGHVEPAVLLIGALNLAAVAFALATFRGLAGAVKVILRMALATLLFVGLTAPIWISFLAALPGAFSLHVEVKAVQFSPANLLGIFDDVFYRLPPFPGADMLLAPGASFLIFVGCLYSFLRWRFLQGNPFFWINSIAIVLWSGCVFGWVPSSLLLSVPLLNRVGHTNVDFSYLLLMHLTIQCAYGFKCIALEKTIRQVAVRLLWTGVVLAGMTLFYCFGVPHGPVPWVYFAVITIGAFGAPLLAACLRNRSRLSIPWAVGVILLGFMPHFRFAFYNSRDLRLMNPGTRVTFDAPSPAIETIKADNASPFRVVGAEYILHGDYAATYGLEDIRSCAPLSNYELVSLLRGFPGMMPHLDWEVDLTNMVAAHPLLNLLNVKYVLVRPTAEVQDGLGFRLADQSDLGIVENLDVWPRAFFSDEIVSISSNDEFVQHLVSHPKQPFIALTPDEIKKQPDLPRLQSNAKAIVTPATRYQLLPNSTAFDIHASAAGVVCLTEGQARDFTATANGERKDVLTVNRAFKGIYLDHPGDYHVEFVYRPRYWRVSCALFWAALSAVLVLLLTETVPRKTATGAGQLPPENKK